MSTAKAPLTLEPDASVEERVETILQAFKGDIEPVRSPLSYRLGITLVAVVMVLLPLIYLGLIGLVCWAVYYHATHHTGLIGAGRGRAAIMTFLIYVAPMVIGGILIVFMFKPLFSRPARQPRTRTLQRKGEPVLFAFVERICDAVGAPRPREIQVDCQVNASASFRRGLWSMLGNDLMLTIGAPLVAGMTLRQFGGVLAHEFGHFAQGVGMRLTYVIRSISMWFTRVVYERDEWDQKLAETAQSVDIWIGWILYLAQFFVWLTRRVLWVLMMVGHGVSGYMLRQMEFDADRHETRLSGSDTFEATVRQLLLLNFAHQSAQGDLNRFYQEGRLADNLPRLIVFNLEQFPPEVQAIVDEAVTKSETGWFDTHPCDRERVANAHREEARGVFRLEAAAEVLFSDFARLSCDVTDDLYKNIFGKQFDSAMVHPVAGLLARQNLEIDCYKALRRYFQNTFSAWRTVRLSRWQLTPPTEPKEAVAHLRQARERLLTELPRYNEAFKRFDEADTRLLQVDQGQALLNAKVKPGRQDFPIAMTNRAQVSEQLRWGAEELEAVEPEMMEFETLAARRLLTALDLLTLPALEKRLENADEYRREGTKLLAALAVLEGQVTPLLQLRNTVASLGMLLSKWEANQNSEALSNEIRDLMATLETKIATQRDVLRATDYPFDHADARMSIGKFALPEMPSGDDLGALYQAGESLMNTLPQLRARMVGRLCQIAEEVEKVLGLEPLPEPPKEEPKPEAEE